MITVVIMELVGGEQDGREIKIAASNCPKVYFAVPQTDESKIRNTRGNAAKSEMRDRLARLAYKFDPEQSTSSRYRMVRTPELDKVPH